MTKFEAQIAICKGRKVAHRFFTKQQFIVLKDGAIQTEGGYLLQGFHDEFWIIRSGQEWEEGWFVMEDDNRCEKEKVVEKYFGLNPIDTTETTAINTDFGHLVSLLYMYEEQSLIKPATGSGK